MRFTENAVLFRIRENKKLSEGGNEFNVVCPTLLILLLFHATTIHYHYRCSRNWVSLPSGLHLICAAVHSYLLEFEWLMINLHLRFATGWL